MRTRETETKPERFLRTSLLLAIPVAIFGGTLGVLHLLHTPYATWLQVEAPAHIMAGSTLDVKITLGQVPEPSLLVVDLYLLEKDGKAIGGHPSLTPSPSARSGGTYSFRIEVKEVEKLAFLQLVIYLSPTAEWGSRTHAASSEAVPVKIQRGPAGNAPSRKIRAFVIGSSQDRNVPSLRSGSPPKRASDCTSVVFRAFLLGLLAACGLVCLIRAALPIPIGSLGKTYEQSFWRGASVPLFLGFLWELLGLEVRLSVWGRSVVSALGLYHFRQSYQKTALALLAAGVSAILVMFFRAVSRNRARLYPVLVSIGLTCYTGLSIAAAFSFHYVDSLKRVSFAGASPIELAKAGCAAAILSLALSAPWQNEAQAKEPGCSRGRDGGGPEEYRPHKGC